jgi:hypothetical protein
LALRRQLSKPWHCEDTCQIACLLDSYCICRICSSIFKV